MSDMQKSPRNRGLQVILDAPNLVLAEIGQSTSIKARLTNTTDIDEEVIVRLLGSLSGPTPATQHVVLAKSFADVEIIVVPPPALPPGQHQLLIEVLSKQTGNVIVSQDVSLEIQETKSIVMHVSPASISRRIRGRISILVRNHDDVTHHVRLRADPDDPSTRVEIEKSDVTVMAGQMVRVKGRIKLKPFFFGKVKDRWFSVVADGSGLPIFARAQARHSPIIGKNIRSLMTLLSILLVWGVITAGIISAIKPVTIQSAASAEGSGDVPPGESSGNQDSIQPPKATISGAITAVPDGSGTTVIWDEVCIGDAGYIENSSSKNIKAVNGCTTSDHEITDRSTESTAEGAYAVTVPDASLLYLVKFSKKGHTTQSRIVEPNGKDVALDITLVPGDGTISGKTVDENGAPMGGATVSLTDGVITYSTVTATTGAGIGTFKFTNLSTPATYVLDARADGRGLSSAIYDLPAKGKRTEIQLTLARNVGSLAGVVTSARFEGSSAPPVEVTVTNGTITRSTTTLSSDLRGVFRLDRLPLNQVLTVTFTSPGFTTVTKLVTLAADSKDLLISLEKSTGSVNGALTLDSNPGNLTKVAITISNSNFTYKATNKVESTGRFDIQGVEPGHYVVLFQTFGVIDMVREVDVVAGSPSNLGKVDLLPISSSASSGSINLLVTPSDVNTGFSPLIRIKRDEESCPASECDYAGTSGVFNIQNVSPGGYIIEVSATGYENKIVPVAVGLTPTEKAVPVVLLPLGSIQGQVTNITGAPIEGITLDLFDANNVKIATSEASSATGSYTFLRQLQAGQYTIRHEANDPLVDKIPVGDNPRVADEYTLARRSITGAAGAMLNIDLVVNVVHLVTGNLERLIPATGRYTKVAPKNVNFYTLNTASPPEWEQVLAPKIATSLGIYRLALTAGSTVGATVSTKKFCAVYHDDDYPSWATPVDKARCAVAKTSFDAAPSVEFSGHVDLVSSSKNIHAIYMNLNLGTSDTTFNDITFAPRPTIQGFVYPCTTDCVIKTTTSTISVPQRIAGAVVTVTQGANESIAVTGSDGKYSIYDTRFDTSASYTISITANLFGKLTQTMSSGGTQLYIPLESVDVRTVVFTSNVEKATITVSSGENCLTGTSSPYTCSISGLALKTLTFTASKSGYVTQTGVAITDNLLTASVNLLPGPSGSLVMVVRNALGVTQQFIQATITSSPDSGSYSPTTSDANGKIQFSAGTLPAGDYTITLTDTNTPPRFVNQSFLVHINSNQTTSLLIDLAAINTVYIPIEVVPAADFGPAIPYPSNVSVSLYKTGVGTECSNVAYTLVSSATSATSGSQEIATFSNIPSGTYYVGVGGCDTGTVSSFNRLAITSYPVVIDAAVTSQWMNPIRLIRTTRQVTASASIGGTQSAITSMSLSGGFLSSDKAGVATGTGSSTTYVFSSVPPGVYTLTMVQSPYPNRIERITVGDANLVTPTTGSWAMDATQRTITVTVKGPSSGALATLSNGAFCTTVNGGTPDVGTCTIANVPDGTYTLTGSATGYATSASAEFTTSSTEKTAEVTLAVATRSVTFTSTGMSDVLITITSSGGGTCTTASTQCTIPDLALTALTYTASKSGYVTQTGLAIAADTTTATVTLAVATRSVTFTAVSGATITVSTGENCVTVSSTCTISGLALTGLTYAASATGYVTQTGLTISDNATTAAVTLAASPTYVLTVTVTGRLTTESIIVSVSGGYTCTIATNGTTSGSCTVTVPAGSYTANATTATKQGSSNSVSVSSTASADITLS
jgi:hypothetical protein